MSDIINTMINGSHVKKGDGNWYKECARQINISRGYMQLEFLRGLDIVRGGRDARVSDMIFRTAMKVAVIQSENPK